MALAIRAVPPQPADVDRHSDRVRSLDAVKRDADHASSQSQQRHYAPEGYCPCGGGCPRCSTPILHARDNVGAPPDRHEREADRAGRAIARGATDLRFVSRSIGGAVTARADGDHLRREIGHGSPLDATSRRFFESGFGRDLGAVRVHTGSAADRSARANDAGAYTLGSDIVFGAGRYSTTCPAGRAVLAHELTHVLQQSSGDAPARIQRLTPDPGHVNTKQSAAEHGKLKVSGRATPYPGLSMVWTENLFVISAAFELRGEQATASNAAKIQQTINTIWTKKFGDSQIITTVTVVVGTPGKQVAANKGVIRLFSTPKDTPSHVEKVGSGTPSDRWIMLNLNDWDINWTPAHEFGHYIGLDDQYKRIGGVDVPNVGWEGDIMAKTGMPVTAAEIPLLRSWWANWAQEYDDLSVMVGQAL